MYIEPFRKCFPDPYASIEIGGGEVVMRPGIYVIMGGKQTAFKVTGGMVFSPIDIEDPSFDYSDAPGIETFDGMLFYQRRANAQGVDIQGGSSEGLMTGTLYAKWTNFKISGQGTYDAQFVCGSMNITGTGDVTLTFGGKKRGKAPAVFLVE